MTRYEVHPQEKSNPTWEIAHLYPDQGAWSEEEYLALETNRLVEYSDGYVEILEMPTQSHQLIVAALYQLLSAYVRSMDLGQVLFAPFRVQLWPGKFREPDVAFMAAEHADRRGERYWQGADLVMEVISPDDRARDQVVKKEEYAQAGIAEYWLVDPLNEQITVFRLQGHDYLEHGLFGRGKMATSQLLPGFDVEVAAVFEAADA
jgi:Uma2 family endonuclease